MNDPIRETEARGTLEEELAGIAEPDLDLLAGRGDRGEAASEFDNGFDNAFDNSFDNSN